VIDEIFGELGSVLLGIMLFLDWNAEFQYRLIVDPDTKLRAKRARIDRAEKLEAKTDALIMRMTAQDKKSR